MVLDKIFPYLKLRTKKQAGKDSFTCKSDIIDNIDLVDLRRSGFIRYSKTGDDLLVKISEGGRWLYEFPHNKKKENELFVFAKVESLAEIVGYPPDWLRQQLKYHNLLNKLTSQYDMDTITQVAQYLVKEVIPNYPSYDLRILLTERAFKSFHSQMEKAKLVSKKKIKPDGRGDGDYGEDQLW